MRDVAIVKIGPSIELNKTQVSVVESDECYPSTTKIRFLDYGSSNEYREFLGTVKVDVGTKPTNGQAVE